ncbi:hypothetical protein BDZ97DRAFT_1833957 [Flammula alnicola]|nr:hypothetical protein BDZ97DRAFT_1833957 [Flammula alnicola]
MNPGCHVLLVQFCFVLLKSLLLCFKPVCPVFLLRGVLYTFFRFVCVRSLQLPWDYEVLLGCACATGWNPSRLGGTVWRVLVLASHLGCLSGLASARGVGHWYSVKAKISLSCTL